MLFASPSPPFPPPPPPPPRDPTLTPEVFVPSFLFFPPRSLLPLPCLSSPFGYSSPKERKGRRLYGGERMAGKGTGRGRGKGNKEACLLRLRLAGRGRKGGAGKGSLGTVNFETRSYFSPTAAALFPAGNIAKLPSLWFAWLASSRRPHCGPPDGHSCLLMVAKKGGLANDWKIP